MKQKIDYIGQELNIGDTVVYNISAETHFYKGIITKITPQLVHIIAYGYIAQRYPDKVLKIKG